MSSPLVCTLLFRWILPLVLLGACCFRFNGFSVIYLCCLLAIPLLPNPSRAATSTAHFQKALMGLSVFALTAQIIFQIVLGALPPYGHFFPNCSTYERLTRQIGLSRFDGVPALDVFRIIAPDVVVIAVSITCVVCSRGLIDSTPLRPQTPQHIKISTDSSTWDNVMPYFIAVMLLVGGIMLPSLASAIYFVMFLILGTMWACHKAVRLRRKRAFAYVRFGLMVYSGLHVLTLYMYQFQFFQRYLPPESLLARLFGLVGIIYTDCSAPLVLHVRPYLDWPQCASPGVILALYWLLATETRFYFVNESCPRYGESKTHWWDLRTWPQSFTSERQSLMAGRGQTNYNTLGSRPENVVAEEPVQPIHEPDEYPDVQGTLGSIMMFLMRQSYIAALIIMMAWSITYHSWLTFVLLLWACLIWITPFARWFCMVSSPGLVVYAELLLLVQYVYGLQLTDDELPLQDPTGTFDYSELGLKKWQFPFLHLGAQTLFTWVFWVTLRQHIREKRMKRRERENEGSLPLRNLAHPFLKALRKMSVPSEEGDSLDPKASDDAKALMMWVKSVLAKYWILLCCGAFLLVGLQNEVSVYQIGYMAIFLFILICYQISIATWRLILRPLWWAMVIYSICILLLIYTYQFDNMPVYWHNATGLSDQWLYNLGLRQHTKASLLLELLTPTAFSIVIVIQLHFFHRPFMAMIDLRVKSHSTSHQSAARGAVEPHNQPSSSQQQEGAEPSETPQEPRPSTQKSFLVAALIRIVNFYNDLTVFLWRVGELHMLKLVNLTLICVVLYQVCAINAVIIILLGISMPSRVLQRALSYCFLIWSSLVILSKMIYQLRFVQADLFQHNCTDQSLPRPSSLNHFINNAMWVGFYKTDNISEDIKGYLLIVIVIVLHAVIKHHQKLYRWRKNLKEPEPGILFPGITRPDADEGFVSCVKYLFNKFFFHFGWEVCLVMIVINMAVRCDVTSVVYAIWLGAFLVLGRQNSSIVWPVYVGFLAVLLPLQYLLVLGWPPALCLAYPWTSTLNPNLVHWLYLTDVKLPPDPKLLMSDFFQLLFACCQENVFSVERFQRSSEQGTSGAAFNSNRRGSRGKTTTTPDFMWNITWLDFSKVFVFQHMYWVTLAVVYITVQSTISIFNFGFILWCFFFLWHGQALYLQPRTRLFKLWKIFIGYNYFTLLAKVCLQLVSCVYVEYVKKHTGCWALQLLSLFCLRQGGYNKSTANTLSDDCVAPSDTGLAMDCACFTFLVIQYRVFTSDYFKHVVRDHREQSDMASRGAELVDQHVRAQLDAVRREDKGKMDRIKKSLSKLKKKLAKLHPAGEQYEPQSHYEAIYSGDYKWFETESEEELESDSPTGTPRHRSRSPSPTAEGEPSEIKDIGNKGKSKEATGAAASSRARTTSSSSAEGEDDFLAVTAPEMPEDNGQSDGFVNKIKKWCSWLYYYVAITVDKVINLLNDISRDYREIADQLKKERKEKRVERLRRKFGYAGARSRLEEDPEADTKSMTSRVTMEDDDAWSASNLDLNEADGSASWRKSNMRISRLTIAFVYALLANTDILCYMLMILNHMVYASVLSMPLPLLVFLWGMLSIPRPTKIFWITVITYTQVVIVVKYLFKFQFIDINDCNRAEGLDKNSPLCPPRLFGIERDNHTSAYDLLLLLVLFFHRYSLKVHGLWRDKANRDNGEDTDEPPTSPVSPPGQFSTGYGGSMVFDGSPSTETSISTQQSQDIEVAEGDGRHKNEERGLCFPVVTFFRRIYDPEIGSGAVDVYAMMFACQFIIFIIIVFSWSAFSSPEPTPQTQFVQIIEQNMVPKTFLYMLLTQFFLIIIDRYLYLRKFVIAKLIYNVCLVILFHVFMFFIVPLVTQRAFIENIPAIFMYIFFCMYFALSAYQIRCGYPTRILGNFLTKSYSLTSGILFQGFQAIPFLLELRSVLDWVCTDTTLTLYHWLKMEDIYANIYVLKVYRESEKTWFQARGQKYWTLSKWGLGGLLVALLVIVIWFPLLLMSYINSVYTSNLPQDATFTLSIGGYQPLFKVSAQEKSLHVLSDSDIDKIKKAVQERPGGGYSETELEALLQPYKGRNQVLQVKIVGNSSSIWTISPPSRDLMIKYLSDNNVTMRFSYEFTREPKTALAQETISGVTQVLLDNATKSQLADMVEGNSTNDVVIKDLFPSFVKVPASGSVTPFLSNNKSNYVTCRLRMRSNGVFDWWELTQITPNPLFGAKENALEMITFNDLVPPLHFSFFTSTGIIGLYVGFVWLVGKFVRLFFTSISYRIMFDEMPNVDKVLKLCLDIFMVRESKELELEEDLFAKLMFLYRSPQTLIKWTKYKRQ